MCYLPYMGRQRNRKCILKNYAMRGAWVAQPVKHPTSAQVMISRSASLSSTSGSVLRAQSLDCFGFCVSLSLTLPCSCSVSLCLKNKTLKKKIKQNKTMPCDVECSVLWVGTQLSSATANKVVSWKL